MSRVSVLQIRPAPNTSPPPTPAPHLRFAGLIRLIDNPVAICVGEQVHADNIHRNLNGLARALGKVDCINARGERGRGERQEIDPGGSLQT